MTRREQFVLLFHACSIIVGAIVAWPPNVDPENEPGIVNRVDPGTASPPAVDRPGNGALPSEASDAAPAAAEREALPKVTVSILGAVRAPGVYRLSAGSRVDDIIKEARGPNADVDLSDINLAATLIDGSTLTSPASPDETGIGRPRLRRNAADPARFNPPQYSISRWQRRDLGSVAPGAGAGRSAGGVGAGGLININTASREQLESLPGLGPVKARAIIRYREESRFAAKTDLMKVSGIGPKTYENIERLVTVR